MNTHKTVDVVLLVLALAVVGCQGGADGSKASAARRYDVRGKVVAVDPAKPAVTLDHEDIPGLMKAMRMEFAVTDANLLKGLKVGDQVQGQLKAGEAGFVLTHLEKRAGQ
jgi:Cu/Ag efflux protein CusF